MGAIHGHHGLMMPGSGAGPWATAISSLDFEGANGSTTFTDSTGRVWTGNGNAQISTAQFAAGAASMLLDGTGDFITTPDTADMRATGDFRVEASIRPATVASVRAVVAKRTIGAANFEYVLQTTATGLVQLVVADSAGTAIVNISSTTALAANTWADLAFQKVGTLWSLAVNGATVASATQSGTPNTVGVLFHIGRDATSTGRDFNGYIDKFRLLR